MKIIKKGIRFLFISNSLEVENKIKDIYPDLIFWGKLGELSELTDKILIDIGYLSILNPKNQPFFSKLQKTLILS